MTPGLQGQNSASRLMFGEAFASIN